MLPEGAVDRQTHAVDISAAGGIVFDDRRRLLLIRRGRPPGVGLWSVPGGKCEPGESPEEACVREVREETGLSVQVLRWAGRVIRDAPGGHRFVIDDYVCDRSDFGDRTEPTAADDAAEVGWFSAAQLATLPLVPQLAETLSAWGLLPD